MLAYLSIGFVLVLLNWTAGFFVELLLFGIRMLLFKLLFFLIKLFFLAGLLPVA